MKTNLHSSHKTLLSSVAAISLFGILFANPLLSLQASAAPTSTPATSYNYIYYITGDNANDNDSLLIKKNKRIVAKTQNELIKEQDKSRLVEAPTRNVSPLGSPSESLARSVPLQPALSAPASVKPAGR